MVCRFEEGTLSQIKRRQCWHEINGKNLRGQTMSILKTAIACSLAGALMAGQPKPAAAAPLPTHISTMKSMVADVTVPAHWHGGGWGWGGWGAGALAGAIIGGAIASSAYGYYGGSYYGYYTRPRYGYYYPRTLYYGNGPYYSGYYGGYYGRPYRAYPRYYGGRRYY
jgi:hypothetical protein